MIRRILQRATHQAHERWNAYVDLIGTENYESLSSIQQVAHLAFAYDAEVQNGGHHQYFVNSAGERATDAVAALETLGAADHATILSEAVAIWRGKSSTPPRNAQEFVDQARESEFEGLDDRFYSCSPDLYRYLESYLDRHEDEFIAYADAG